jgi:hypothetical protein
LVVANFITKAQFKERANAQPPPNPADRESMRQFGWTNPILIGAGNEVIAGHGRLAAAKLLGMEQVPAIHLEVLSDEQIRAYIIADNKLAENAGWDRSILAIELQNLMTLDCADFDVTITGFEVAGKCSPVPFRAKDLLVCPEMRAGLEHSL